MSCMFCTDDMRPSQEMPDVTVTLIADKWVSDTTSDGAAGLWEVRWSANRVITLIEHLPLTPIPLYMSGKFLTDVMCAALQA